MRWQPLAPVITVGCFLLGLGACGDDLGPKVAKATSTTTTETGAADSTTISTASAEAVMTPDGYGRLRLGMTVEEAKAAGGPAGRYENQSDFCDVLILSDPDVEATLLGERPADRKLGLIWTDDPAVKTARGVGAGSTAGDVRAAYPNATDGNVQQSPAISVEGTPGYLKFKVDADSGRPVPDDAAVVSVAVVDAAMERSEEYCA